MGDQVTDRKCSMLNISDALLHFYHHHIAGRIGCFQCFLKCEVAFGNGLHMQPSAVDFCFVLKCEELFCPLMKQGGFGECFH